MKRFTATYVLTAILFVPLTSLAEEMFGGDVKLSCEAILCLSSGQRPDECSPSIQRYFSIHMRKMSDTLKARKNFLNICPTAQQDQNMRALVDDITNGSDRCDYAALNVSLTFFGDSENGISYIRNTMPSFCTAYYDNTNIDIKAPRYVGIPKRGGYWVEANKYEATLAQYSARIKAEDESTRRRVFKK